VRARQTYKLFTTGGIAGGTVVTIDGRGAITDGIVDGIAAGTAATITGAGTAPIIAGGTAHIGIDPTIAVITART